MVKNRSKIENPSYGSTLIGPVGKLAVGGLAIAHVVGFLCPHKTDQMPKPNDIMGEIELARAKVEKYRNVPPEVSKSNELKTEYRPLYTPSTNTKFKKILSSLLSAIEWIVIALVIFFILAFIGKQLDRGSYSDKYDYIEGRAWDDRRI